jgi:hypothetical protein
VSVNAQGSDKSKEADEVTDSQSTFHPAVADVSDDLDFVAWD